MAVRSPSPSAVFPLPDTTLLLLLRVAFVYFFLGPFVQPLPGRCTSMSRLAASRRGAS